MRNNFCSRLVAEGYGGNGRGTGAGVVAGAGIFY